MATTIKLTTVKTGSVPTIMEEYTTPTNSAAGASEDFYAPIEAADGKGFFVINNEGGSADVDVSLTSGDFVGKADTKPVTVGAGSTAVLFADSALCKTKDGLGLRLTPAAGAALNGCGVKLAAVQFLPVTNY